jgi:UDP-3-O-[3-hydroxymyristoyl] glucosamine N-acyltransferase
MPLTADQVARLVHGELIGPGTVRLATVAPLESAGPGELTFLESSRYLPYLAPSCAGAVLLTPAFRAVRGGPATRIVVPDARAALGVVLRVLYAPPAPPWGVHPTAQIGRGARWNGRIAVGAHVVLEPGARLGADCVIGPHAVIGAGARLGAACRIGEHAVLHPAVRLGDRVVVHAGARVGGEGFGFTPGERGAERLPHVGRCEIADDVEIGANTTIDRGGVGDTRIGPGTKIDNLVHIAHNVHIGARCLIMAQVGIAGSCVVEDDVLLAGQAGLADHLTVHRGARVAAQSGVIGDIAAETAVSGYPARSHREVLRQTAAIRRLTPLVQRLERIVHHDHTA